MKSKIELRQLSLVDSNSISRIKELIWEYFKWGNIRLKENYGFELNIQEMLDRFLLELPAYCLPNTRLYKVIYETEIIGLGGFKIKEEKVIELKRVYLQNQYRGNGFGRILVSQLINDAKMLGYNKIWLESADFMDEAYSLYKSLGFVKVKKYKGIETPEEYSKFIYCMELELVSQNS